MRKRRLVKVVSLMAVVAVAGLTGVVVALASGGLSPASPPVTSVGPGPGREARAFNLASASSQPVFSLRDGEEVAIRRRNGARCLMRTLAGRLAGEVCASDSGSASGEGINITDECGSSGDQLMEITGLAPEGVTSVRLLYSDGSSVSASVEEGAFKFEGQNPSPGERYPTGVEWLGAGGAVGAAGLPVHGDEYCLPAG
jgi:hypothetical protein